MSHQRSDSAGLVLGHGNFGNNLQFVGRFTEARYHLERVHVLYDPTGHRSLVDQVGVYPQVTSRGLLAIVLFCLGYPDQGLAQNNAALAEARRLAHLPSLADGLGVTARLLSLLGDDAVLGERADQLVAVAAEQGFPQWGALGSIYRGWVRVKNGDVTEGISLLHNGSVAYRATGAALGTPFLLALLAGAYEIVGQIEEAEALVDEALQTVDRTGERWFTAELNRHKGQLLLSQGDPEAAEELYWKALSTAREQQAKMWELRAAVSLAQLRRPEARELLVPVYGWFTEGFDTPDLKVAKALLEELQPAARSGSRELPGSERRRQPTRSGT